MKKTVLIISALLVLVTSLKVFAGQYNVYTPQVYKQSGMKPSNTRSNLNGGAIELLIDYSGSMTDWIKIALETMEVIVPRIDKDVNLSLRVFGDAWRYSSLCKASRMVTRFKKDNNANVLIGLKGTQIGGSTPIEFALKETIEKDLSLIYTPGIKKKIILVTDGHDVCGGDPCAYIRQVMKIRNDIQIDVVQMGQGDELMCLTAATGGRYYKVDNRIRFENAFEQSFSVPQGTVSKEREAKQAPQQNKTAPRGYKFINY